MIASGLKRLALIFLTVTGETAVVSLVAGLLVGASALRAVSLGFMITGSFIFCIGAAIGLRGSTRPTYREDGTRSGVRVAPAAEVTEGLNLSAIFVGLGLLLIFVGIASDPRTRLF